MNAPASAIARSRSKARHTQLNTTSSSCTAHATTSTQDIFTRYRKIVTITSVYRGQYWVPEPSTARYTNTDYSSVQMEAQNHSDTVQIIQDMRVERDHPKSVPNNVDPASNDRHAITSAAHTKSTKKQTRAAQALPATTNSPKECTRDAVHSGAHLHAPAVPTRPEIMRHPALPAHMARPRARPPITHRVLPHPHRRSRSVPGTAHGCKRGVQRSCPVGEPGAQQQARGALQRERVVDQRAPRARPLLLERRHHCGRVRVWRVVVVRVRDGVRARRRWGCR